MSETISSSASGLRFRQDTVSAWWVYPDQDNGDGRHIGYLNQPERLRHHDPDVFDALTRIVSASQRHVGALEAADLRPDAIFHSDMIPTAGPETQHRQARREWFQTVVATLDEADFVFGDPDNGLKPAGFSHGSGKKAGKSVTMDELGQLRRLGRCLILYHHRAGGHHPEIDHRRGQLRQVGFARVDALRAKPLSPSVFFLLDAPADIRQGAERGAVDWQGFST